VFVLAGLAAAWNPQPAGAQVSAPLPAGVRAVWDSAKAQRETTPTRERISLNGLWRWQPAGVPTEQVPAGGWGYFKVPGSWPGISNYMQKDSQTVFAHPEWTTRTYAGVTAAWYEREFKVPPGWGGRRITATIEYLNSLATVFVDGNRVGEIRFPAGEIDLTSVCRPGATQVLSVLVVALPLKGLMLSYTDSASAREVKGAVPRRGLCGDVYLVSEPAGPRIRSTTTGTSVRRQEFTFAAELENLGEGARYTLDARVTDGDRILREFTSRPFQASEAKTGQIECTEKWLPEKRWDLHTPANTYALEISLRDAGGRTLDVHWTTRLGVREFWIEGRDFFLNGTRLHLSAVPLDNAQIGAALSTYSAARETLERLKGFGINFVYTHNYGCEPGSHLSFAEILRAADDVGMLVSLSQPHFSHYDWQAPEADANNGYARHAAFYARVAGAHPSVVTYSMSHNATGYAEDMNPDLIDGRRDPREARAARNSTLALRAEAIVRRLDPRRIVYHHASGNLGAMHVINFYPNFVPVQELSDWFGHWAVDGVKPAFMCEYGAPFTWDWTMYRGWYQGKREFGSAKVPWEFCLAEWNAQFFGDRAYAISEAEKTNLRWEAKQFRAGNLWHRWDYPHQVGSTQFDERYPVFALYLTDNWRAFRTWGVSAISPWEYGHFWKLREGVKKGRQDFTVDWENLQRPGFSPDFIDQRFERMDIAFERSDWIATSAADALRRNNRPLLAYLGGKADAFTSKDHNFMAGESLEKQIVVINDSREPIACDSQWSLGLPVPVTGRGRVTVAPGAQERMPLRFELPKLLAPGRYELSANFSFSNGETQTDRLFLHVLAPAAAVPPGSKIALFDPRGETRILLAGLGVHSQAVDTATDLSAFELLIVGKGALTASGEAPAISRVRDGLKVILFEQTAEVLEQRFGLRIAEYGLRQVFRRVPDHPALAGLTTENLRDWRGEATLQPARLNYEPQPRQGPTVQWSGIPVPRLWRCGNRGNVASVLIEKPPRGDFLSLLDGGYGLHYSTLLEYREGRGMVLFCQTDVTGRTENDPAAEKLVRGLLTYAAAWVPGPRRRAVYAGEPAGKSHLESTGITVRSYEGGKLSPDEVLVVGPGGGRSLAGAKTVVADWLAAGGNLLTLGIDQGDADALLPFKVSLKSAEHIATLFPPPGSSSLLAGISPADVHNRDPRVLPLIAGGARIIGNGVVGQAEKGNVVLCQVAPWQFDGKQSANLKRTHRRTAVLVARLLANLGVAGSTPLLERFSQPVENAGAKRGQRWLTGFYLDQPEEWDDPYRFFRW
jgi:beta-galactosidase